MLYVTFLCLLLVSLACCAPARGDGRTLAGLPDPVCRDLNISVPFFQNGTSIVPSQKRQDTGTFIYYIFGKYCRPSGVSSSTTIQLLLHGTGSDHTVWNGEGSANSGPYQGSNYSYEAYTASQGYSTLAIDRLGYGLSSKPDPRRLTGVAYQVEVIRSVAGQLYNGNLGIANIREVVPLSHSQGSVVLVNYLNKYPTTFARAIITGWTSAIAGAILNPDLLSNPSKPASEVNALKWGNLTDGYTVGTDMTKSRRLSYYTPANGSSYFDENMFQQEFANRGLGNAAESGDDIFSTFVKPVKFTGDVLVVTGDHDAYACAHFFSTTGDCQNGKMLANSQSYFSAAKSFRYITALNSGHNFFFHYSRQDTFKKVHSWLKSI